MKPWEKLGEDPPVKVGFRKIINRHFRLPNGREVNWQIKDEGMGAAVLALTAAKQVILVKQFRPGPEEILMELPGGNVDAQENPLEAAKRELLEETGYSGEVEAIGSHFDCANSSRIRNAFVATNCHKTSEPHPEEDERLECAG